MNTDNLAWARMSPVSIRSDTGKSQYATTSSEARLVNTKRWSNSALRLMSFVDNSRCGVRQAGFPYPTRYCPRFDGGESIRARCFRKPAVVLRENALSLV